MMNNTQDEKIEKVNLKFYLDEIGFPLAYSVDLGKSNKKVLDNLYSSIESRFTYLTNIEFWNDAKNLYELRNLSKEIARFIIDHMSANYDSFLNENYSTKVVEEFFKDVNDAAYWYAKQLKHKFKLLLRKEEELQYEIQTARL